MRMIRGRKCGTASPPGIKWPIWAIQPGFVRADTEGKKPPAIGDMMAAGERNELLTPAEVAVLFRVNPKTVTRWARAGKISAIRTLGGHRRFRRDEIEAVLRSEEAFGL
jgi:excisionase family DNA binding protein